MDWVFERKSMSDLVGSIRDSRYDRQKIMMARCGLRVPCYVLEGDPNDIRDCEASVKAAKTAGFETEILSGAAPPPRPPPCARSPSPCPVERVQPQSVGQAAFLLVFQLRALCLLFRALCRHTVVMQRRRGGTEGDHLLPPRPPHRAPALLSTRRPLPALSRSCPHHISSSHSATAGRARYSPKFSGVGPC